ncbi:DNA primase [candidate division WWE3 bacterium CG10_big_fil_rev_8_21_14_0_10_48_23]|nr:MAG: DNA primase [candidate division WWE3 bacterium CG_4_10_14_0_2_um_filter_47_8]PJE52112.1 MAG: DNA primase [candidate division WWE3 bacterium CG10_big_fil_rev_8_21_14_0_10_48_23]
MVDQIQEVKDKLDIVAVISSYFPLTKAGKNYKALCPFHVEKTPSFMVSPELQIFKCFGCGEGGDAIAFYAKMEGVSFGEALREMAKRAGIKLIQRQETPEEERREMVYRINQLAADFFHYLLAKHKVGEKARAFFKGRGLKEEAVETFGLGYAPSSWDSLGTFILSKKYTLTDYLTSGLGVKKDPSAGSGQGRGFYDFFRGRVIFPFRSSTGRVVGFSARALGDEDPKYIHTSETPAFKKREFLYNLDLAKGEIKRTREAILVEGMMDAIALWEKGIKNVVATMGTALTTNQVALLSRFAGSLKICFDKDSAGMEATKKGIMLAQAAGLEVKAVLLPFGKDPDEAIRSNESAFRHALEEALPIFDFYLASALERFDHKAPAGKKKIATELLPILKSFANEVEKAAYLKKLSEVLDVPEESLWQQLEKEEVLEVEKRPLVAKKISYPMREAYLFALVISFPPREIKKWLRRLSPDDLSDPLLREILSKLKSYFREVKRFRLANFSAKLDEEQRKVLEEIALLPLPFQKISSDEEIEAVVGAVKRARYKRELRGLVGAVKEAEKAQKEKEVKRLQKEVLKLSEKIRKL